MYICSIFFRKVKLEKKTFLGIKQKFGNFFLLLSPSSTSGQGKPLSLFIYLFL